MKTDKAREMFIFQLSPHIHHECGSQLISRMVLMIPFQGFLYGQANTSFTVGHKKKSTRV
jgi:hypothetical protein